MSHIYESMMERNAATKNTKALPCFTLRDNLHESLLVKRASKRHIIQSIIQYTTNGRRSTRQSQNQDALQSKRLHSQTLLLYSCPWESSQSIINIRFRCWRVSATTIQYQSFPKPMPRNKISLISNSSLLWNKKKRFHSSQDTPVVTIYQGPRSQSIGFLPPLTNYKKQFQA